MPLFTNLPLTAEWTLPTHASLREIWGSARKVARFHGGPRDGQIMELPAYDPRIRFPVYTNPVTVAGGDLPAPSERLQTQVEEYVVTGQTIHGMNEWINTTVATNYTIEIEYSAASSAAWTTNQMSTWYQWNQNQFPLTPEQEAARARRLLRDKRIQIRASKRARKTLTRFLDPEQLAAYAATGRFKVVASNGWVFELRKNGNPLLLGDDGHADASFCIHPRERFPDEDKLLSFMLLLMSDVEDFLRIANRTTIRQRTLAPVPPTIPAVELQQARQEEEWRREHVRESQAMLRAEGLSDAEVEALRRPPNHADGLLVVGQAA